MDKRILIVGATSRIAQETARIYSEKGARLFLVARSLEKLEAVSKDLKVRGADKVDFAAIDINDISKHGDVLNQADKSLEGIDLVLIAHGILGDPKQTHHAYDSAEHVIRTNFLSKVSLLILLAARFEKKKSGCIAVISSVAGDRGRKSNYVYGASKAALNAYLQGLRGQLASSGVHVLTLKPGMVDTPMTAHFKKGPLFTDAKSVAKGIFKAVQSRKEQVYLPGYWRFIMWIIRMIPERIFKRLNL